MNIYKKASIILVISLLIFAIPFISKQLYFKYTTWGFARSVPESEKDLRMKLVNTAMQWLDTQEFDSRHIEILEIYNSHTPLAQGYPVKPEDDWCATFGSAMAISAELTEIIPTECGCQRQISLFSKIGRWQESDSYVPLPGDYIFYAWDEPVAGDCTGWSDHVGIVVGTSGSYIKVIEGNKDDAVSIRIIPVNHYQIRGFGLPDYASLC